MDETTTIEINTISPPLREACRNAGLTVKDETSPIDLVRELNSQATGLRVKADRYDALRTAEIETVVKDRIAAEGDAFTADKQASVRGMLGKMDTVEEIREYGSPFTAAAQERFKNGRQTEDAPKDKDGKDGDEREADGAEVKLPAATEDNLKRLANLFGTAN